MNGVGNIPRYSRSTSRYRRNSLTSKEEKALFTVEPSLKVNVLIQAHEDSDALRQFEDQSQHTEPRSDTEEVEIKFYKNLKLEIGRESKPEKEKSIAGQNLAGAVCSEANEENNDAEPKSVLVDIKV